MGLETGEFIDDLVITNPTTNDPKSEGDDHFRLIKKVLQQSFPGVDAEVPATAAEMNVVFSGSEFTGMVAAFPLDKTDPKWLECRGQTESRTTFAGLFDYLGETYGAGNGTTTFNLPDYRGEFLRGQAQGSNNDPDRASRTDRGDGTTGDFPGTKQDHDLDSHEHLTRQSNGTSVVSAGLGRAGADNSAAGAGRDTDAFGGNETRPTNVNVVYMIHV